MQVSLLCNVRRERGQYIVRNSISKNRMPRPKRLLIPAHDITSGFFWTPGSEPTLRPCHETSRIFTGTKRIFASCDVGDVIFLKVRFEGKRDFWLFGLPQLLKKPKQSKSPFFEKTNRLNDIPSDTRKICE